MPIGYEFQPGQEKRLRGNLNRPGGGALSPAAQQAIRVISTRMPNVLGGRPPAPEALLKPQVGGNTAPGAVASSVLKSSGGSGGPAPQSTVPTAPELPSPTNTPFATLSPSAGRGEPTALNNIVNNALGGGKGPAANFDFEGGPERKMPPSTPTPPPAPAPSAPQPMPIDLRRPAAPVAPDNSLEELLRLISIHDDWGGMNGGGSYGLDG